jgi:Baseplate J-like protein
MSRPRIDYTNKDYASLRAALLELASERLPEWTDQSPNDLGVLLLELFASMGDSLFYNQDRIAGESFLETAVERRSVVNLLRLIGYELRPPLAASADLTLLFDKSATAAFTINQFDAFKTTAAVTGTPIDFQYIQATPITLELKELPFGLLDARGTLNVMDKNAALPSSLLSGTAAYRVYQSLPVVQIDATVVKEIVASSDGSAGQRYALARAPVVDDTLVVTVNEGGGPAAWTRVPSLLKSLDTDTHYAVRRDENGVVWIEFGDNTYGKAPRRGLNNITADYAVGGGVKGNVPAGAISKVVTSGTPLTRVLNPKAASGGTEAEGTADAVLRGPQQFRAMGRAVTAADYEALARSFGVAKVLARSAGWNTIQLIVAPAGGGAPSDTLKDDLRAYLEPKRIMTSLIEIVGPTYVAVHIEADVTVVPQFSTSLVRQQVVNAVDTLLGFDNLQFNQPLYISKLYEVIQDIDGVLFVNIKTFTRDPSAASGPQLPLDGKLSFGAKDSGETKDSGELPIWKGFDGELNSLTINGGRG